MTDKKKYNIAQDKEYFDSLYEKAQKIHNEGRDFLNKSGYKKAYEYFSQALEIRETLPDDEATAATLNNIGIIFERIGEFPKSLEYLYRALRLYEKAGNSQRIIGTSNNIAATLIRTGNQDKAVEFLGQCLCKCEEANDIRGKALTLGNLGTAYLELDAEIAIEYLQKSLELWREIDEVPFIIHSILNIGLALENSGEYATALQMLNDALRLCANTGDPDTNAKILCGIGRIYKKQGEDEKAINVFKAALQIAQRLQMVFVMSEIHGHLADIYAQKGDFEKAFYYHTTVFC